MTINYLNGTSVNAVLLSRGKDALQAAVLGEDDARVFKLVSGTWISEDCEPVRIEFAWQRHGNATVPTEADCVCPKELASRLISMLLTGSQGEDVLEDMLWVFCAEGQQLRIDHSHLAVGAADLVTATLRN